MAKKLYRTREILNKQGRVVDFEFYYPWWAKILKFVHFWGDYE